MSAPKVIKQEFSLVIIPTHEDAVLVLKPYCVRCATHKLDALRFCSISHEDSMNLIKQYNVKAKRVKCECPSK